MYDTGMRLDQSVATVHAILDTMPDSWARGELAEAHAINPALLRVTTGALESLSVIERLGKEERGGSHQRLILFGATELLVDAAVDFNRFYFGLIEKSMPDMSPAAIKYGAVGLLAVKHALPEAAPPNDVIRVANRHRSEHPTHTVYHMLELFVKERNLGKEVGKQMLQHVRAHPLVQNGQRARRAAMRNRAYQPAGA